LKKKNKENKTKPAGAASHESRAAFKNQKEN
jgi:hypothetical protein